MANAIPRHVRDNYERTDDALHEIHGLTLALDIAMDQITDEGSMLDSNSRANIAKDVVIRILLEKLQDIHKLRSMEWLGQGGESTNLTDDEIAVARGNAIQK